MALTTTQIYNLNNSMSAAQDVSLGTLLDAYASNKVISGSFVPAAAVTEVVTGLTTVTNAVVCLSGSPSLTHAWTTVVTGSIAGHVLVYCWQPTNASTVTPVAGTVFNQVNWIAVGT
jgi:hypothetical protein